MQKRAGTLTDSCPKPEIVCHRSPGKPRISVILIDWGVRESFHSLEYLNRQTAPRDSYELIWLEFYARKPKKLQALVASSSAQMPLLDKWMILGYPDHYIFHKHRLYNVGILMAEGDICVICDSDAIFQPTFIAKLIQEFDAHPNSVVHVDEVRNVNKAFYPFRYPTIDDILGPGCANWQNGTTLGLDNSPDMLHHANYGACMAAWRKDLLAIGGADEDIDYLGYVCGPYDLTFRLLNYGRQERWLRDEYLYHTWHPNAYGSNVDYHGPHDGYHMALLALEARGTARIRPYGMNPWMSRTWWTPTLAPNKLLRLIGERPEPAWTSGTQPPQPAERVYQIRRNYVGFDVYYHAGNWYALLAGSRPLHPCKLRRGAYREIWQAPTQDGLMHQLKFEHERWKQFVAQCPLPARLWKKIRAQPLHCLPGRMARKGLRLLASKAPAG